MKGGNKQVETLRQLLIFTWQQLEFTERQPQPNHAETAWLFFLRHYDIYAYSLKRAKSFSSFLILIDFWALRRLTQHYHTADLAAEILSRLSQMENWTGNMFF